MGTPCVTQRAVALGLACMLVSCGTTRSAVVGPTSPQDLTRYALVFEQQPDGQLVHAWVPLKELDLTKIQRPLGTLNIRRHIVRTSSSGLNAYCDGRHDQCMKDCLKSSRPFVMGYRKYMDTQAQPWRIARIW